MPSSFLSLKKILRLLIIFTLITVPVDQWSKAVSRSNFLVHEDPSDTTIYQGKRYEILSLGSDESWMILNMTYVRNHGASWGLMRDLSGSLRISLLLFFGLFFGGLLCFAAVRFSDQGNDRLAMALVLMVAGSLGNFIDRVRIGYVVDFVSLRAKAFGVSWTLPAFNVADIIIVLSLFCIVTMALQKKKTILG